MRCHLEIEIAEILALVLEYIHDLLSLTEVMKENEAAINEVVFLLGVLIGED